MAADIATLSIRVDSSQVKAATKEVDNLAQAATDLDGILRKFASALAVMKMVEWVKDTALLAARYDTLGVAMTTVGKNAGYTATSMLWYQKALQETGISAVEARNTLTMMASAQIDLSKSSQLARIAQDAAVIGNLNSSEAFERMVQGIRSGQVEILRTIGINVNFEQGYQATAKALGKTTANLSEYEKMQSRTNQVMDYGKNIAGTYEAAMGTAGKQMKSMERYAQDLQTQLGAIFQPALATAVSEMTKSMKETSDVLQKNKTVANELAAALAEVVRQGAEMMKTINMMNGDTAGPGGGALAKATVGLGGLMAVARDYLRVITGGGVGALRDALDGKGNATSDWLKRTVAKPDRTYADWAGAGMSDSEGLEGGDPYGAIAARKKADALAAAAKAAEEYAKVITPLNQALAMERTLLEEGDRAAYARSLDMQKIKEADKEALLQKWDYNKALRDQAENEEWLAKLDKEIRQGERQRVNTVFGINQRDLEAEAAQMERALNVVYPYRQEILALGQAYEDLAAALEAGTITQEQFTKGEEELLRKTQQTLPVMTEAFGDLRDTIQNWSRSSTEAFLDLAFKGKAAFSDLISSMLRDLARLAVQRNVMDPLFSYLGMAISGFSGGGGTPNPELGAGSVGASPAGYTAAPAKGGPSANVQINITPGKGVDAQTSGAKGTDLFQMIQPALNAWAVKESRAGGILARA